MSRPARALWISLALLGAGSSASLTADSRARAPLRRAASVFGGFADIHPSLLVTNPRVLAELELDGFSFGDAFGVARQGEARRSDYAEESAKELTASSRYADIADALTRDIDELRATIPDAGVGAQFTHRLFDPRWLRSERAHFELVAVANRIDMKLDSMPGCGQTRFIYRLELRPASRPQTALPMTVSLIHENAGRDCAPLALQWLALESAGGELAARLRQGPLSAHDAAGFDRVEVDLQSLRENSQGQTSDDHSEYILRAFRADGAHLVADGLRNTPAVDPTDDSARESLRAWIVANVDAIDRGTAELPRELLAKRAVSLTPRGLSRLGNRPFKAIFPDEERAFGALALTGKRKVRTPKMLVRRLDAMSCVGCHQSRSIAGFHVLGEERDERTRDALVLGISEHLREVLPWRFRLLSAIADGRHFDEPAPFAERADGDGYGAHCTMHDDSWPCAKGIVCRATVVDDAIGACLPPGAPEVGDPCENVRLGAPPRHEGAHEGDFVAREPFDQCATDARGKPMFCDANRHGFVGGMCSAKCRIEGERSGGAVCKRVPAFGFEHACFKKDAILERCLPFNAVPTLVRACSRSEPCRDDYVCARVEGAPIDEGACVPPYFLFQARVDGPPVDR